ncbi:hypothetical protein OG792_18885 [Micromonospora sp. NBC_01699]|nr:hypothetical protein [Micromonospora sp. NBC_01699]
MHAHPWWRNANTPAPECVANVLGYGVNDTAGEVALGPGLSDQTR